MKKYSILLTLLIVASHRATAGESQPSAEAVLKGLQAFAKTTAVADGSFRPGVDPDYRGGIDHPGWKIAVSGNPAGESAARLKRAPALRRDTVDNGPVFDRN